MIWLVVKGVWSVLSFGFGHLISAVPVLLKLWQGKNDDTHELEMKKQDVILAQNEAVYRSKELAEQVETLRMTLEARVQLATHEERMKLLDLQAQALKGNVAHQAAGDRAEQTILDTTNVANIRKSLPYRNPKGWWQNFLNGAVALTFVVAAWMRPVSFTVILSTDIVLVYWEFQMVSGSGFDEAKITAFSTLGAVSVLTDALPMILGVLWGKRDHDQAR